MHALNHVPTEQLMHEIVERALVRKDAIAAPYSVLQLLCAMTAMMGTQQNFEIANALRDAADQLENPERVHVE